MGKPATSDRRAYRPLCLLICGGALSGNKGAIAMTLTVAREIRAIVPGCRLRLLSKDPAHDAALAAQEGIELVTARPRQLLTTTLVRSLAASCLPRDRRSLLWDGILRAYAEADCVVDVTGVSFSDDATWRTWLLGIGWLLPALATGTPYTKLSQTLGPFRKPLNRWLARQLLPRCGLIITRGEQAQREVSELLGLDPPCPVCADTAFLLEPASDATVDAELRAVGAPIRGFVGVSPSAIVAWKSESRQKGGATTYRQVMCDLIEYILKSTGLPVVIVPHAAERALGPVDYELSREVCAGLPAEAPVFLLSGEQDPWLLKGIITRAEAFVACRFHALVAALSSGVPTLAVGWGHKYVDAMKLFGVAEFHHNFADISDDKLRVSFSRLWEQREMLRARLRALLPAVQDSARENFRLLYAFWKAKGLV